jgi:hypothetical protein
VQQLEEVNTGVPNTDDMFFDGIDGIEPRVMSMFDLNFPDILRRSSDSAANYYSTMRTKDPDVFDCVKRAHFDDGFQAVTTDDAELLWAYRLVRTKHYLKDTGSHKHSPTGFV